LAGGYVEVSFDLGLQAFTLGNTTYHTAEGAKLDVLLDGVVVQTIQASDITAGDNEMQHFSCVVNDGAGGTHSIGFHDTTADNYVGFALDSIAVKDWVC
jgi:hypothetical protein